MTSHTQSFQPSITTYHMREHASTRAHDAEAPVFEQKILNSAEPHDIECAEDLEEEMQNITRTLSTNTSNWKDRVNALKKLRGIVKANGHHFPNFWKLLWELRAGMAIQVCELRSAVCKEACITLCFLAISTRDDLETFADSMIPHLLKIVTISIMIISHYGNVTLRTILRYSRISKGVNSILNGCRDRNSILRVRCMEYIQLVIEVQTHVKPMYMSRNTFETLVAPQIIANISDANESVRLISRRCVWALDALLPGIASLLLGKLDSANARRVQDERLQYSPFGPIVGKGHKISVNYQSTISSCNFFSFDDSSQSTTPTSVSIIPRMNRPKTAIPHRYRRLENLKRKMKQEKEQPEKHGPLRRNRPQSANVSRLSHPTRVEIEAKTPVTRRKKRTKKSLLGTARRMVSHELFSSDDNDEFESDGSDEEFHATPIRTRICKLELEESFVPETPSIVTTSSHSLAHTSQITTAHHILSEIQSCSNPYVMQQHLGRLFGTIIDLPREEKEGFILQMIQVLRIIPPQLIFNASSAVDGLCTIVESVLRSQVSLSTISLLLQIIFSWLKNLDEIERRAALSKVLLQFSSRSTFSNDLDAVIPCLQRDRDERFIGFEFMSIMLSHCRSEITKFTVSVDDATKIIEAIVNNIVYENDHVTLNTNELSIIEDCLELCVGLCSDQIELRRSLSPTIVQSLMGIITSDDISRFLVQSSLPTPLCPNKRKHRESLFGSQLTEEVITPSKRRKRDSMLLSSPLYVEDLDRQWTTIDIDDSNEHDKENHRQMNLQSTMPSHDDFHLHFDENQPIEEKIMSLKRCAHWLTMHDNQSHDIHFSKQVNEILKTSIEILNSDEFELHRQALKILQSICWNYRDIVNNNIQIVLLGLIKCFRECAPWESGECAQDVMSQFTRAVDVERCLELLLCNLRTEFGGDSHAGKEIFACLNILDRLMVRMTRDMLRQNIQEIRSILVETYWKCKYREAMRSLIYAAVILDDDSFLSEHPHVQKMVSYMRNKEEFVEWVESHRSTEVVSSV